MDLAGWLVATSWRQGFCSLPRPPGGRGGPLRHGPDRGGAGTDGGRLTPRPSGAAGRRVDTDRAAVPHGHGPLALRPRPPRPPAIGRQPWRHCVRHTASLLSSVPAAARPPGRHGPANPHPPRRQGHHGGVGSRPTYGLTKREAEVLVEVAAGCTNREIAANLFISESTAGVHVSNILGKLGVSTRTEAARLGARSGPGRRPRRQGGRPRPGRGGRSRRGSVARGGVQQCRVRHGRRIARPDHALAPVGGRRGGESWPLVKKLKPSYAPSPFNQPYWIHMSPGKNTSVTGPCQAPSSFSMRTSETGGPSWCAWSPRRCCSGWSSMLACSRSPASCSSWFVVSAAGIGRTAPCCEPARHRLRALGCPVVAGAGRVD